MSEPAIRTSGLTKRYGELVAVDHVDLAVARGETFGLLGPNGAGKTTTILMLLGLSEPSEGTATVAGLDPTRNPLQVKRRVGYLPDNVGFYPNLTGRQNLAYTARLNGVSEPAAGARIDTLLDRVGLRAASDSPAGTYSRGMRQRLGIADALIKDPQVLILDEPTVGIDPEGVREILALIQGLSREREVTVLLSSHLLYQVEAICDRVAIFVAGRAVTQGRLGELAADLSGKRFVIEVEVATDGVPGDWLMSIPGALAVEQRERLWVITADRDVRAQIARGFVERDLPLVGLRRRGTELDDIYARYFEGFGGERDGD